MGMYAAMVAAASMGIAGSYSAAKIADDSDAFLPLRHRPDRNKGGSRGKRHSDRPAKRSNMKVISKRVRRKHRRSAQS